MPRRSGRCLDPVQREVMFRAEAAEFLVRWGIPPGEEILSALAGTLGSVFDAGRIDGVESCVYGQRRSSKPQAGSTS